jgi:MFS family permease
MASKSQEFKRGWSVLLACFVGIGVSLVSLIYYSGGIWVKPWQEEFGWTRAEIGLGQGLGTVAIVLGAPLAGALIDRYGLRRMASLSLILYGLGIYLISTMSGGLWMFYVMFFLMSLAALPSTPLGFTRAVNAWFDQNRGLALGISLTSTGVGGFLIPKLLTPYVAVHGWRSGFVVLATMVLVAVPIVYLLVRNEPDIVDVQDNATPEDQEGISLRAASKMRSFWMLAVIFFFIAVAVLGLIPSFIPLLQDAGMDAAQAGGLAAYLGLSVVVGRLATGWLIDRIFAPYVLFGVFVFVALGCLALGLGGVSYALLGAIALGLAVGAEVDLIGYFTAKYYGMKHYGSIYGVMYSIFSLGAIISPVVAGAIWDHHGNYNLALYLAAGLVATAAVMALALPKFNT